MTDFSIEESKPVSCFMPKPEVQHPELRRALRAVNYLNSWVRSDSYRHAVLSRQSRHAVYHLKRYAIEAAQNAGMATHRRVGMVATCRDCGGSGRYYDSYGYEHDHCRRSTLR